jgi:hypothetical protein
MSYPSKEAVEAALSTVFDRVEIEDEPATFQAQDHSRKWRQGVTYHRVRALDVGSRAAQSRLTHAIKIVAQDGSETWHLESPPSDHRQETEELVSWLTDYQARPWVRVLTMRNQSTFQSASIKAFVMNAGTPELRFFVVAPVGGAFRAVETAEFVEL